MPIRVNRGLNITMSPLPQRKKSPEELAALRESLGIPPEPAKASPDSDNPDAPPNPDHPPDTPESATPAFAPSPETESTPSPEPPDDSPPAPPEETPPTPLAPRSLRKSCGLIVDQPKGQTSRGYANAIPTRRRTDQELKEIRRTALTSPDPTTVVARRLAHPVTLFAFYCLTLFGIAIGFAGVAIGQTSPIDLPYPWLRDWVKSDAYIHHLFAIFATTAAIMLICAAWLAIFRPISRHHAGFLFLIALLTLTFSSVFCYF